MGKEFDEKRPFGSIRGSTRARYIQDGEYFDSKRQWMPDPYNNEEEPVVTTKQSEPKAPEKTPEPVDELGNTRTHKIETIGAPTEEPDLSTLHWKQLAKLVQEKGGQYENKEQAITFLKGE